MNTQTLLTEEDSRRELAKRLAELIDRNGMVNSKSSSPFLATLKMTLKRGKLTARLVANQSPYTNGSTFVEVKRGRTCLFEASGDMHLRMSVRKDVASGTWEEELGLPM